MPVEYRGFEGVTKFFYLACTKIQGVQAVRVFRPDRLLIYRRYFCKYRAMAPAMTAKPMGRERVS